MTTKYPKVIIEKVIENLYIKFGECVTVDLAQDERNCNLIRVELRVNSEGKPFIFVDKSKILVRDFTEWDELYADGKFN